MDFLKILADNSLFPPIAFSFRDHAWELCTLFDINFQPRNMSVAELQTGFLKLAKQLYSAKETRQRRSNFKRRLRTSPNFGRTPAPPLSPHWRSDFGDALRRPRYAKRLECGALAPLFCRIF